MIIAIDGPAAAGKGTLCQSLADQFDLALLDTGLLYRGVGKKVLTLSKNPNDPKIAEAVARELVVEDLDSESLRSEEIARAASQVSSIPEVRSALLDFQRNFAKNPGINFKGAILDGRDIGTVVCPDADIKIFLHASAEVRAERRYKELKKRGVEVIYSRVLEALRERDARDMGRAAAPLKPARDAFVLDTSKMRAVQVFEEVLEFVSHQRVG